MTRSPLERRHGEPPRFKRLQRAARLHRIPPPRARQHREEPRAMPIAQLENIVERHAPQLPHHLQRAPEIARPPVTLLHGPPASGFARCPGNRRESPHTPHAPSPDFRLRMRVLQRRNRRRQNQRIANLLRLDEKDAHLLAVFYQGSRKRMAMTFTSRSHSSIQNLIANLPARYTKYSRPEGAFSTRTLPL